ncbi:MAG: HAD hydrolase family protein [Candidatus Rokuibacteriota bacterium]
MALSPALRRRLQKVRMVIMDVDGVLTDAGMYYSESGEELKKFNTRDGHGITLLHAAGIKTALVTRERTPIVTRRAAKLGIAEVHQGALDKLPVVRGILDKHGVAAAEACYIGDDVGDHEVMGYVGFAAAVADALPEIKKIAHYVTRKKGGEGAVREVCDLILEARVDRRRRP